MPMYDSPDVTSAQETAENPRYETQGAIAHYDRVDGKGWRVSMLIHFVGVIVAEMPRAQFLGIWTQNICFGLYALTPTPKS